MSEPGWQLVADDLCRIRCGDDATALAAALRDAHDWLEVVSGRDIVCVQFDPAQIEPEQVLTLLGAFDFSSAVQTPVAEPIDIPACYDPAVAPDLVSTCEQLGLSRDEFIRAHTSATHEVAMLGFMPGFAYIDGLDPSLQVERLDQPRQQVAAGSIGIAGSQTGIYPSDGPGGWRLVARTPLKLFDPENDPPASLQPMQRVRFVPITLGELEASQ